MKTWGRYKTDHKLGFEITQNLLDIDSKEFKL